jgi:hypothetical protein
VKYPETLQKKYSLGQEIKKRRVFLDKKFYNALMKTALTSSSSFPEV